MGTYLVKRVGAPDDEKPRVVEAGQKATALNFVAKSSFTADLITTREAMALGRDGVELETAGDA